MQIAINVVNGNVDRINDYLSKGYKFVSSIAQIVSVSSPYSSASKGDIIFILEKEV